MNKGETIHRNVFRGSSTVIVPWREMLAKTDPGLHPAPVAPKPIEARHQVIVLFAGKGGAGATTLAINIAHTYALARRQVCLLDMDLLLGDAAAGLKMKRPTTVAQAVRSLREGGVSTLDLVSRHGSGLSMISQVGSLDDLDTVKAEEIPTLINNMRRYFDHVVIDGIHDFSDLALATLDASDRVVIVSAPEVLALKRIRWVTSILERIGYSAAEQLIVLNRYTPETEAHLDFIRKTFPAIPVLPIGREDELTDTALYKGVALSELAGHHWITESVRDLAWVLAGDLKPETIAKPRPSEETVLGRLFHRKKK